MKEALFYEKLPNRSVKCNLCRQFCQISDSNRGLCGVRENQQGILYSLVYGKVIARNIDPIEKKPLFNFMPGSRSYSIATVGCNFRCANCQNADISQASKEGLFFKQKLIPGDDLAPADLVKEAVSYLCHSIAYTYTEPTVFFEFAFDCMKLAHEQGLKNIWVSNGYTAPEALMTARPYLDAVNIDLKFFSEQNYKKICGARLQPILDNLIWYKRNNIWLEVTTLIVPSLNDDDDQLKAIASFIKDKLGSETPWHISAFFPTYRLMELPPTPTATIQRAWQIGKDVGLKYVYGGNVMDSRMESTFCPNCDEMVIERIGYQIKRLDKNRKCPNCQSLVDIVE